MIRAPTQFLGQSPSHQTFSWI